MRLIACHIENFGKLRELDYTFHDGVNVIHEENGWGKTTFAAFIKAMFYGMPSTTKRSVLENERKKYLPWQGGSYGGNLTFANENAAYRIERFFGEKDKDDTFVLYDQATGLESRDYSALIGEEIFGINMEGYERSAYIPQLGLNITTNDSINAKLSNLIDDSNDINHYETALSALEDAMRVYKKTGNRGQLAELEARLLDIDRRLEESAGAEEALNVWEMRLRSKKAELAKADTEEQEIKKKIIVASQYEAQKAKQEHYAGLCEEKRRVEASRKALLDFFKGHEPTEEELREKVEQHNSLSELSAKINAETEKQVFFEQAYKETCADGTDYTKIIGYCMGVGALILWAFSAVLFLRFMAVVAGVSTAVAGVIALVLFIVLVKRSSKTKKEIRQKAYEVSEKCRVAGENTRHLQQIRQAHEVELSGMIRFYFNDMRPSEMRECIEELRNRKLALKNADEEYARICETVEAFEHQNHINAGSTQGENPSAGQAYETLQELQRREGQAGQRIDALKKEIAEMTGKTEQMNRTLEERAELEGERDRIAAALEQKHEHYEVLEDTVKYLKKAKEKLSLHYFGDIQESFEKYINMLCVSLSGTVNVDVKLDVKIEAGGAKRELDFYSAGYKDLIGICTRLALIDVLFAEEKPFVILDDPFSNLDEEKLKSMLKMLQSIGTEYQIIYFICHNSRGL